MRPLPRGKELNSLAARVLRAHFYPHPRELCQRTQAGMGTGSAGHDNTRAVLAAAAHTRTCSSAVSSIEPDGSCVFEVVVNIISCCDHQHCHVRFRQRTCTRTSAATAARFSRSKRKGLT